MRNKWLAKLFLIWFTIGLVAEGVEIGAAGSIEAWVTTRDRSALFQKQVVPITFHMGNQGRDGGEIVIDPRHQMQHIEGFGFALTGGSAELLTKMDAHSRAEVLRELFSEHSKDIGVSYLRLSIGASDMNSFVFSYDDLPKGETDAGLTHFDLAQDKRDVIPVLKKILAIAPKIKILGSPWSAPAWMKTNKYVRGGALAEQFYPSYALYLVKYIQAMHSEGISIDAITIQNEPLNSHNTPSMQWTVEQQRVFLRKHLFPALIRR
jgi:glucosylceramidase